MKQVTALPLKELRDAVEKGEAAVFLALLDQVTDNHHGVRAEATEMGHSHEKWVG